MIRRFVASTMVLAGSLMVGQSVYAAPSAAIHVPVFAKMKDKAMVSFHMRNDSKEPLIVKAGGTQMTLEPGKPVDVSLKVGEEVKVAKGTPRFAEGLVLTTVSNDLKDTTIVLR